MYSAYSVLRTFAGSGHHLKKEKSGEVRYEKGRPPKSGAASSGNGSTAYQNGSSGGRQSNNSSSNNPMLGGYYKDGFWVTTTPVDETSRMTMPGPAYLCRPSWPSFLDPLPTRATVLSSTFTRKSSDMLS